MFESFLGVNPWTALFILLNTLTIFFVAKKFLFQPVMQIIADRQKEIDDTYAAAAKAKSHANAMEDAYRQKLEEAQQTGERMVKEAVVRAQNREEEILRQANTQADAIRSKAEAAIAREKKKAVNDAKDEIAGIAMEIAEKVVGRSIDSKDQADLVDQFIRQLGDGV